MSGCEGMAWFDRACPELAEGLHMMVRQAHHERSGGLTISGWRDHHDGSTEPTLSLPKGSP